MNTKIKIISTPTDYGHKYYMSSGFVPEDSDYKCPFCNETRSKQNARMLVRDSGYLQSVYKTIAIGIEEYPRIATTFMDGDFVNKKFCFPRRYHCYTCGAEWEVYDKSEIYEGDKV